MSDKTQPTALNLPMVDPLPAATQKYFDVCQDKLGMIPNVLQAYAFDIDKRQLSGDPMLGEQMVMNWRAADLEPRVAAMLEFSENLTVASAKTTEADRQTLRDHGFSDRDIWDIASVAAFFNMTNRVASATDMRPNDAYHSQFR